MRIERIVASVPEECRRPTCDLDVRDRAIESRQKRVLRLIADVAGRLDDAIGDAVIVADGPARLLSDDLRTFDKCSALPQMRAATQAVCLEDRDLHRNLPPSDERLAIGEERVLARSVLRLDRLEAEVSARSEEAPVLGAGRTQQRSSYNGAPDPR